MRDAAARRPVSTAALRRRVAVCDAGTPRHPASTRLCRPSLKHISCAAGTAVGRSSVPYSPTAWAWAVQRQCERHRS